MDSRYFYPPDREPVVEGPYGCLVITADKGLAGAYNQNVIKEAQKLMEEHGDMQLFVVGEYGRHFFTPAPHPHRAHLSLHRPKPHHGAGQGDQLPASR